MATSTAKKAPVDAEKQISDVLHVFDKDINAHPDKFVQEDQDFEAKLTKITKTLFDLGKRLKNIIITHTNVQ